jgi:preprotein translocase subunit Sss1
MSKGEIMVFGLVIVGVIALVIYLIVKVAARSQDR